MAAVNSSSSFGNKGETEQSRKAILVSCTAAAAAAAATNA
jgi:hypothetical protein